MFAVLFYMFWKKRMLRRLRCKHVSKVKILLVMVMGCLATSIICTISLGNRSYDSIGFLDPVIFTMVSKLDEAQPVNTPPRPIREPEGDQVKTVVDKINSIKHWKKRAYGRHDLHDIGDEYELFIPHNELETTPVKPAPFIADQPRTVLLLSYQRSGSSFIADWLFGNRADTIYLYEPLDAVYTSIYGVEQGWTIPSDITTYINGSHRVPPADEQHAVSSFLQQIFSCQISSIPKPIFLHKYALHWRRVVPSMEAYENCSRPVVTDSRCYKYMNQMCGKRFHAPRRWNDQKICKEMLWHGKHNISVSGHQHSIAIYNECVDDDMESLRDCVPILQKACTGSHLRATKTVRGTMEEMEPLLEADPNFRLLHLYRDPRPVYRSRRLQSWTWSAFENTNKTAWKTAFVYCQTVKHDYIKRRELESKYPGRIKNIVYDTFMLDPEKSRREIYDFLDISLEKHKNTDNSGTNKGKERAVVPRNHTNEKWMYELQPVIVKEIEAACQEFADLIGAKWRPKEAT